MSTTPLKHCGICNKDYPATTDYFYPSHLKEEKGRNQCKTCHQKKNSRKNSSIREKLTASAQPISRDALPLYRTFSSIARSLGWTQARVARDVCNLRLPIFTYLYNNTGPAFALKLEDAETYVASHSAVSRARRLPATGTPTKCGACGTEEGNIICDADTITKVWRGYLCASCYRLARLIRDYQQGDSERLHQVLRYVKRTAH